MKQKRVTEEQTKRLLLSRSVVESSAAPTVPARRDRPEVIRKAPAHSSEVAGV